LRYFDDCVGKVCFFALGSGSEVGITVSLIEMKKVIFIDRNECKMLRFHIMSAVPNKIVNCVTSAKNDIFPSSVKVTTRVKRMWYSREWYSHETEIVFCTCYARYFI